jgi:hypothetical protein
MLFAAKINKNRENSIMCGMRWEKRRVNERIPKEAFSEQFKALPYAKKLAIRRKLAQDCLALNKETGLLADQIKQFSTEVMDSFEKEKVDVHALKEKAYGLSLQKRRLAEKINSFTSKAKPYFKVFEPNNGSKSFSENPLEVMIHKSVQLLSQLTRYEENAQRDIGSIEYRQFKGKS